MSSGIVDAGVVFINTSPPPRLPHHAPLAVIASRCTSRSTDKRFWPGSRAVLLLPIAFFNATCSYRARMIRGLDQNALLRRQRPSAGPCAMDAS
ncbi:hypothetical protein MRX96_005218 [Rhipicephalus microplus]